MNNKTVDESKAWTKILSNPFLAKQINQSLASALLHCHIVDGGGWSFRCSECHISNGTYLKSDGFDWHSHLEYQIELALSGSFEFETAKGTKIKLNKGQALLIPMRLPHRWRCTSTGTMIGISLELIPTLNSMEKRGILLSDIKTISNPAILTFAEELILNSKQEFTDGYISKMISSWLFLLIGTIFSEIIPHTKPSLTKDSSSDIKNKHLIGAILKHIELNIKEKISLTKISKKMGISSRQLHRIFQKHVGKSLHDYLMEQRLEKARKLLLKLGDKALIKEVAFQTGFQSAAYFSNIFKKTFGIAPTSMLEEKVVLKQRFTTFSHSNPNSSSKSDWLDL